MKTSELIGPALDWAVAKCEGRKAAMWERKLRLFRTVGYDINEYSPSTNWAQGGPIIDREKIDSSFAPDCNLWDCQTADQQWCFSGLTLLSAAMRCYVASKLGDEVEIPKELM